MKETLEMHLTSVAGVALAAFALVAVPAAVLAQGGSGSIAGNVKDTTGSPCLV